MSTISERTSTSDLVKQLVEQVKVLTDQNAQLTQDQNTLKAAAKGFHKELDDLDDKPTKPTMTNRPKFPKPKTYDSYKGDVRNFLTQAQAYLRVNESTLTSAKDQILYISNLLTRKAMEWWELTLRAYLKHSNKASADVIHVFSDYKTFKERLLSAFRNPNEHKEATRQLTRLKQTRSAAHYTWEFKRIVSKLN